MSTDAPPTSVGSLSARRGGRALILFASGALVALLGVAGCPGSLNDPAAFELDASAEGGPCPDIPSGLLAPRCGLSGCHAGPMPAEGLDLVSPDVYERLVGKSAMEGPGVLIDPGGDPNKSDLYLKLTPTPPFGLQMPLTGAKLNAASLACVADWIMARGGDGAAPLGDATAGDSAPPGDGAPSADAPPPTDASDAAAPDAGPADAGAG
jgi:hypothetical protein